MNKQFYDTPGLITNCNDEEEIPNLSNFPLLQAKVWEMQLQRKEIVLTGPIKEDLIEKAVIQIFNFNNNDECLLDENPKYVREPITIYINTIGGVVDETFSLISAMLSSKTPIWTVVLGKAYSAGFLISLAGHQRFAQRFSSLMYHQGVGGIVSNFAKIQDYNNYVQNLQKKVEKYVIERTKIKEKKLLEVFKSNHDWYMDSDEALKLGVINYII